MKDEIRAVTDRYAAELKRGIDQRVAEVGQDDRSCVLIEPDYQISIPIARWLKSIRRSLFIDGTRCFA